MTELYIDKQAVVLPDNFSITLVEENPFFTKNGKYTYDIELSLEHPANARIYKHINRLNNKNAPFKNRSAYMVVDNEVVLNGIEVILEITDKTVKIQLASGNSELNYLIGGDRKLREMDLGSAVKYSGTTTQINTQIINDLKRPYPERDWMLLPFYSESEGMTGNRYTVRLWWNEDHYEDYYELNYLYSGQQLVTANVYYENYRPQPYLCTIIEKVLKALGYSIDRNALAEHAVFRYFYIVHGYDTLEFAKMLPDWTVEEFFSKIETQFDCRLLIDEFKKTVNIVFNHQSGSFHTVELEVDDSYSQEIDEDNEKTVANANIAYNLDDIEYYKYQDLDDAIENYAITDTFIDVAILLGSFAITPDPQRLRKIFKNGRDEFIAFQSWAGVLYPKKVNSFKPLMQNESEDIDLEFDILPAPMKAESGYIGSTISTQFNYQMPVVLSSDPFYVDEEEEQYTIQDLIEGNEEIGTTTNVSSKMYVAIYDGLKPLNPNKTQTVQLPAYPMGYVESLAEYFTDFETLDYMTKDPDLNPFRLKWLKDNLYIYSQNINTTKKYKFTFYTTKKMDITSKFIINNTPFQCTKIERTITVKGFSKDAKGEFYVFDE